MSQLKLNGRLRSVADVTIPACAPSPPNSALNSVRPELTETTCPHDPRRAMDGSAIHNRLADVTSRCRPSENSPSTRNRCVAPDPRNSTAFGSSRIDTNSASPVSQRTPSEPAPRWLRLSISTVTTTPLTKCPLALVGPVLNGVPQFAGSLNLIPSIS